MKDLGPKSYVLFQLQGTILSAKLWFCRRLNLCRPNTTSPPPSDGRGTQVVESTGSGIQGATYRLRHGNLKRRNSVTITQSNFKLAAGSTSRFHLVSTISSHRNLGAAGKGTNRLQSWIKGKKSIECFVASISPLVRRRRQFPPRIPVGIESAQRK